MDKIILTIDMVETVLEADHVVTTADDAKLEKYFKELDGEDYQKTRGIGMPLRDFAKEMDNLYWKENLQHAIVALFGEKYEAYY